MYAKQKSDAPVVGAGKKRARRFGTGNDLGGGRSAFGDAALFCGGADDHRPAGRKPGLEFLCQMVCHCSGGISDAHAAL